MVLQHKLIGAEDRGEDANPSTFLALRQLDVIDAFAVPGAVAVKEGKGWFRHVFLVTA
jgi:hypothetical protein